MAEGLPIDARTWADIAAAAEARVFSNGRWHFGPGDEALRTLHHIAGGAFFATGEPLQAQRRP